MTIRLGMLGMWHSHSPGIVRRVSEHPDEFQLVGFYDPDPEIVVRRKREWAALIPEVRVFDTPEQLLNEKLDGVVVESRVYENVNLARMALESGRPVMLEKPAGDNIEDHRKLIELAQRKHLHVQMIYLFRYMSAVVEMIKRAKAGDFGRLYEFRARLPKDLPSYDRYVEELGRYKGGIFFEMAGHMVDIMVAVMGKPKRVAPFMGHHHTEPPDDFIDNGVAVCEFDHGWGILEVPCLEVVPYTRRFELYGTKGACIIPHLGSGHLANKNVQPITVHAGGDGDWEQVDLPAATLQIADLREFAAIITGKKAPEYSMEHDVNVQEALIKASGME